MDLVVATIAIAYVPLLEKICAVLGMSRPIYRRPAAWLNIIEVSVENIATKARHIFDGGDSPTLQDSAESAAMQAAIFLVRSFKIMVIDISLDLRARHERAAQYFACKRDWFAKMEQGSYPKLNYEISPTEGIDFSLYRVEIDFLELLKAAIHKYTIPLTPIDVMQFRPGVYVASTSISVPGSVCMDHTFTGREADSADDAKQILAKEVLPSLALLYRFEVMDINYHFLKVETAILKAERRNYIRLKERVYGLTEEEDPTPNIIEQDQMTPKGKRTKIPIPNEAPILTKRSRNSLESSSIQPTIPDAVVTPELKFPEIRPRRD